MVDPKTKQLHEYFNPEHVSGEKLEHGKQAMKFAGQAHDALAKHDEAAALSLLQIALAELKLSGYTELVHMSQPPPGANSAADVPTGTSPEARVGRRKRRQRSPAAKARKPKSEKNSAADAAQAEEVKKAQAEVVEQIKQAMAKSPAQGKKQAEATANKESKLAEKTHELAKTVKANAAGSKEKQAAGSELTGAAQSQHEAAAAMKAGNLPKRAG